MRLAPYDRARHGDGPWRVVAAVFEEYGFPFEENRYDDDVLHPERHYDGIHGWMTVAEDDTGDVAGCIGLTDNGAGVFEVHRLYVSTSVRRGGTGGALLNWAVGEARRRGGRRLILYSDVHFRDAHRLYRRSGFRCTKFRYAPDPWQSREWGFELELTSPH